MRNDANASSPPQGRTLLQRSAHQAQRSTIRAQRALRVAIAGGGTGGHLFPGVAIAQEFMKRNPNTHIKFISSGNELERSVFGRAGFELACIRVEGIKGRGIWRQLRAFFKLPAAVWASMRILSRFRPDLILALGSYSAGPAVLGARLLGIPIVLQEQNIFPGITNKAVARFAKRIYVSFAETAAYFSADRVRLTGNPVRQDILDLITVPAQSRQAFTVLVVGGSQGAHRLNQAVIDALAHLQHRDSLVFVHQTGAADQGAVENAYVQQGVHATARAFFEDMARQYQQADLIVCRAGATTVAEITAIGRPAIFVPFPYAADDHQRHNAKALADAGAAEMILERDLTGEVLADRINYYVNNREALDTMSRRAAEFGKPAAAEMIVDDCYALIESAD
jgi:UDP-N-acetylglucosamine--N-acetylmuramyl-(pentapeptide) pyrophosphoryl-undecaprenol N-acetylglucosamine transferase